MAAPVQGAMVEIVELVPDEQTVEALPCIKPRAVRINGVDVGLLARDGVTVDIGDEGEALKVTLVLLPKTVVFEAQVR